MLKEISEQQFVKCLPERERPLGSSLAFPAGLTFLAEEDLGNFSVVVIRSRTGHLFAGVSKRNPCDRRSEVGLCVAAVRALRALQGRDPGYCRQRPVSKREAKMISAHDRVINALDRND